MGRTPCSKKSNRSGKFIRKSLHPPCCNPRAVFPPLCSFLLIQFLSEFCRTVCVRVCGSGSKRTLWIEDRRTRFESVLVLNLSYLSIESRFFLFQTFSISNSNDSHFSSLFVGEIEIEIVEKRTSLLFLRERMEEREKKKEEAKE